MSSESTSSDFFFQLLAWTEENWKRILAGAGVVVLLGLTIAVWRHQAESRLLAANDALLQLNLDPDTEPQAADFLQVVKDYSGTEVSDRALLLGAEALFEAGKFEEARTRFETYRSAQVGGLFEASAAYGSAACLEAMGKLPEALAAYRQVASSFTGQPISIQAKMAAGLILERQDQFTEAHQLYSEVAQVAPGTLGNAWAGEADARKSRLENLHPELQPAPLAVPGGTTNAPLPVVP